MLEEICMWGRMAGWAARSWEVAIWVLGVLVAEIMGAGGCSAWTRVGIFGALSLGLFVRVVAKCVWV